ncbi:MAG: hypothetical protein ABJB86_19375 [Bacteroidota bacterium]
MKQAIPVWITILTSVITLSGLAFSITLYFSPQIFFPATDFLLKDVRHFTDMWAMRQFAFALLLVYALVTQQAQTLKPAIALMICLNILTIADGAVAGDKKVVIESIVYTVLASVMFAGLNKPAGKRFPVMNA